MITDAHTPVAIRAHCSEHPTRHGTCPACQRAQLAAMQAQITCAMKAKTEHPTASELLLRASRAENAAH
jgi:hypothetical protein